EQLGGKRRDVSGPVHAGDRKRLNQLIAKRCILWPDDLLQCVLDLTDESDLARSSGRQPPELTQKAVVRGFDTAIGEGLGDVVALRLFDIEADPLDALFDVVI